jgi:hypothetical protein
MMRFSVLCAVVATCALALTAGVAGASDGATVTRATVPSGFVDQDNVVYLATCDYTQVINNNQRTETFRCTLDAEVPAPIVCDTSIGCLWFSDLDGAEATETHFVINQAGLMVGWAKY